MFLKNLLGPLLSKLYTSNTCYAEKIQYVLAGFTWLWSWKMCHFYLGVTQPAAVRCHSAQQLPNAFVSLVRHQIWEKRKEDSYDMKYECLFPIRKASSIFSLNLAFWLLLWLACLWFSVRRHFLGGGGAADSGEGMYCTIHTWYNKALERKLYPRNPMKERRSYQHIA